MEKSSQILSFPGTPQKNAQVFFDRMEFLSLINIYGKMVAAGQWRDYAIGSTKELAIFAVHRSASERPLYQIIKNPKLRHKQGAFAILSAQGDTLKRGHDLGTLLKFFEKKLIRVV